jgi:hypothetical protein
MPYVRAWYRWDYGITVYTSVANFYCIHDVSVSDPNFGKCYVLSGFRALFTYDGSETPACQYENTCTRFSNRVGFRNLTTVFDGTKQRIVNYFVVRNHVSHDDFQLPWGRPNIGVYPNTEVGNYLWFHPTHEFRSVTYPYYDVVANMMWDYRPYNITKGVVGVMKWAGMLLTNTLYLVNVEVNRSPMWVISAGTVHYVVEASPLAIIKLSHEEWMAYRELRQAFDFSADGIHQPGWNTNDIINALMEIFPDRAWAVFDGVDTLYVYGLDFDDVPNELIEHLSIGTVEVLRGRISAEEASRWINDIKSYFSEY